MNGTRRRDALEALVFAAIAVIPMLPQVVHALLQEVPRFTVFGDWAVIELAARHAFDRGILLGPYSRFRWHHPGPLFFYFLAPFEAAYGASKAIFVGAAVLNAGSALLLAGLTRLLTTRAHAAAAVVLVILWAAAFGNVVANPWNPLAVTLPFTAYLVFVSLAASGSYVAFYPAVFLGSLVAQTHIATLSTVVLVAVGSLVATVLRWRRNGSADAAEKRHLIRAAGLALGLWLAPLVEQAAAPRGNLRKLLSFFLDRPEPLKPLAHAARDWAIASAWLPQRLLRGSLLDEDVFPMVMRWDPLPAVTSHSVVVWAVAYVAVLAAAARFARLRIDATIGAWIAASLLADVLAVSALTSIVGPEYHYLAFWTTGASFVGWLGFAATIAVMMAEEAERRGIPQRTRSRALFAGGLVLALSAAAMQLPWLTRFPHASGSRPDLGPAFAAVHVALRERLATMDATVPVVHREGAWDMGAAMLLELDRDRVDVRVTEADRWNFDGIRVWRGEPALHVYFATTPEPLDLAPCLTRLTQAGDLALFVATTEVTSCPPKRE
jgi:hypothetical protein